MRSSLELCLVLVLGAALAGVVGACSSDAEQAGPAQESAGTSPSPIPGRACPERSPLTYQSFGAPFFASYCTGCHSSKLAPERRAGAPPGVDFDSLAGITANAVRIYARAADDHTTMPPAGDPSAEQRRLLGDWLACGSPGEETPIDARSLPPEAPLPAECRARPNPLPPELLRRCSAETWACLADCDITDFSCPGTCIANDTTPTGTDFGFEFGCSSCINFQHYECTDANGCHDVVAELECCRRDKCATSPDPNCLVEKCTSEAYAYQYCLYSVTPDCVSLVDGPARGCFPDDVSPRDAGADGPSP
jgi:hypothetical protein